MTNKEAIKLLNQSGGIFKSFKDYNFNKAIVEAEERLEKIKKTIDRIGTVPEKYKEYQDKLQKLAIDFAKKDDNGEPILNEKPIGNGKSRYVFDFDEKRKHERVDAFKQLEDKYKEAISEYEDMQSKLSDALSANCDYEKVDADIKNVMKRMDTSQFRVANKLLNVIKQ